MPIPGNQPVVMGAAPAPSCPVLSRVYCKAVFSHCPKRQTTFCCTNSDPEFCASASGGCHISILLKEAFSTRKSAKGRGILLQSSPGQIQPLLLSLCRQHPPLHNNNHLSTNRQQSFSESNELWSEPRQEGFNVQHRKLGEAINYIALLLKEQKKREYFRQTWPKKKR